jgi:conflict system pore-forming effector with SLATT domain
MRQEDYPWLQCASDEASREAQKWYFRLLAVQLALFFLVGLIGAIQHFLPLAMQRHVTVGISALLALAVIATLLSRERKLDKTWFDSRAVAESARTATWRFMMGAPPFQPQGASNVEAIFLSEMDEIKMARADMNELLSGRAANVQPISDYMRGLRQSDFATRKAAYLKDRVADQRDWYTAKARWNQRQRTTWYWASVGLQILALVIAIFAASYGGSLLGAVGVLMTAAASATAWSQAKRHDELPNSYGLAAQELRTIYTLIERADDENTFRALVDKGEEAISREHTMWCARRSIWMSLNSKK